MHRLYTEAERHARREGRVVADAVTVADHTGKRRRRRRLRRPQPPAGSRTGAVVRFLDTRIVVSKQCEGHVFGVGVYLVLVGHVVDIEAHLGTGQQEQAVVAGADVCLRG